MKIRLSAAEFFQADEQTDKHDEAKSCVSQFCECAQKLNIFIPYTPGYVFLTGAQKT
jgi:hypothetical protein